MIDWTRVSDLREEVGEEDFEEVVDLFISEVDTEIRGLRNVVDGQTLQGQLHFLKGSALNLGFSAFAELCQKAELSAAQDGPDPMPLDAIFDCYAASKSEFFSALNRIAAA